MSKNINCLVHDKVDYSRTMGFSLIVTFTRIDPFSGIMT